jgi:hypothetical protein
VYVLLGVSDNTAENEYRTETSFRPQPIVCVPMCHRPAPDQTFVYFIGVFESLLLAKENLSRLMETTKTKRSDYIIKRTYLNETYGYDWSINEEDEVK